MTDVTPKNDCFCVHVTMVFVYFCIVEMKE